MCIEEWHDNKRVSYKKRCLYGPESSRNDSMNELGSKHKQVYPDYDEEHQGAFKSHQFE